MPRHTDSTGRIVSATSRILVGTALQDGASSEEWRREGTRMLLEGVFGLLAALAA